MNADDAIRYERFFVNLRFPVSIYIIYFYISLLRGAKWLNHGVKRRFTTTNLYLNATKMYLNATNLYRKATNLYSHILFRPNVAFACKNLVPQRIKQVPQICIEKLRLQENVALRQIILDLTTFVFKCYICREK